MVQEHEYAVNQTGYIKQRMAQIAADRDAARQTAQAENAAPSSPRSLYRHPGLRRSVYWCTGDDLATQNWFDGDNSRSDRLYFSHMRKMGANGRQRMAAQCYLDPGRTPNESLTIENTVTLFARLILLGIISV